MYNPLRPRDEGLIEAIKAIVKLEAENKKYFPVPEIPKIDFSSFIPDPPKPDYSAIAKLLGLSKSQPQVSLPSSIFGSLAPKEKNRVFISFDYDHDEDLKNLLVGQAKNPDSPFNISDWSIKEPIRAINWENHVYEKIKKVDTVIIIVGEYTNYASGVLKEIIMTKQAKVAYFGLHGRKDKYCPIPSGLEKTYRWSWDNLKSLLNGGR